MCNVPVVQLSKLCLAEVSERKRRGLDDDLGRAIRRDASFEFGS